MTTTMTVRELIEGLQELPPEALIFISVIKYPNEFPLASNWEESDSVEVVPLEKDEIVFKENIVLISVELTDYEAERQESMPG